MIGCGMGTLRQASLTASEDGQGLQVRRVPLGLQANDPATHQPSAHHLNVALRQLCVRMARLSPCRLLGTGDAWHGRVGPQPCLHQCSGLLEPGLSDLHPTGGQVRRGRTANPPWALYPHQACTRHHSCAVHGLYSYAKSKVPTLLAGTEVRTPPRATAVTRATPRLAAGSPPTTCR